MSIKCPNKSHPDWKAIENKYGEDAAWTAYILAGEEIPSLTDASYVINNKVREGSFEVFNSSSELSKIGNLIEYNQYLDTIFPDSKVKDIVYHHSSQKIENFDKSFLGKETSAPDTQLGFFFAEDKNDIPKMVVEKNKQLEELGENKRLDFSVQNNVLLNIKNPEFYYGFIEEAVSNILGREAIITSATARQDYKEAKAKLESNNKDALIYGLTAEPDGEGGTDVNQGYVVFEPEQIHILGSKQDIEGFKAFVAPKQDVQELFESNTELANKVYEALGFNNIIKPNDKIVWGHPAIGKTTMLESNPNAFIDWDNEFNRKRDNWITSKSNTTIGTPEFKKARNEYMINYNNHKDYVAFVKEEWNKAKEKANKENKTLIASPHMLLNLFPNDFDKVITMSDKTFMDRAIKRSGGDEVNSKLWKEGINKTLQSIDKPKIIETDKFINDLFITPQQKQQAQQLYSEYLDTIFPDSKVKDIVYHGANEPIEGERFIKMPGATGGGIWFSGSRRYAQIQMDRAQPSESLIGRKLRGAPTMYQVVLNIKNPRHFYDATGALLVQTPREFEKQYDRTVNDAALFHHPDSKKPATADSADQVVVFKPEQIHILGSKSDIEGFKEFISSEKIVEKQESFDGSSINKSPEQFSVGKSPKIKYQKASLEESVEKNNFEIIKTLKTAILTQLEAMGVGVGVLDYYEGINGVFDPQGAKDATTGLINLIRVAKGEVGDAAIPEEFAHFVDAVLRQQNSPIFKRLTDLLTNEEIVKEIFERDEKGSYDLYNRLYGGNMALMAAEARAKLIARHIIKNEEIKQSPWSSLMNRVKDFFKRIFSKADANSLENTLERIDKTYSKFALELMGNKIDLNFNLDNMRNERFMYNAHNNLNDAEKVFTQVVELRAKQFKIGEKRYSKEEKSWQENILSDLEAFKAQSRNVEGILAGVNFALEDFDRVRNLTKEFKANMDGSKQSVANFAKHLRELKSYTNAYTPLAKAIDAYMLSDEYINTPIVNLDSVMRDLKDILGKAEQEYLSNAMPLFRNFIKQFSGKLIGSVIRGEVFTEEMFDRLLIESNRDIGLAEKLLYSMSNTSELMLRLIERPVKEANRKKMDEANELVMDMQFAQEKLEKAGFKTDFLYEFDSKGIPTGFWISDVDWAKYRAEEEKKKTELNNKYGNPNNDRNPRASLWKKEYMQWKQENTEPDENTPKKSIYTPENFNKLAPAQKEFYYTILEVKKQMMSHLPEYEQNLLLAPQYRKDFLDILRESKNMKDAVKRYKTLIGDQFIDRESDDVYGAKNRLKNFDDTKLETLPIYYTRPLSDPAQLSLDVVSTMALYVDMALGYKYMNEIVDIMELGRDLMKKRKIQDTRGGKPLQEIIESAGRTISSKIIKPTGSSDFMDRLNEFYSNQIYGVSQKDEGTIKIPFTNTHLSIAKSANQLNKYTAMNTYAFNLLGGVANVLTGKAMTRIEAMAGEYLGVKESAKADRIYAKWLPDIISDLGRRRDITLPSLLFRKFNTFQDYEQSLREIRQNKKNLIGRYFTGSTAFFVNNAGEHYLAAKIFLGMAQRYLLKDSRGNEVPLYEAFEVVKNDKGREVLQLKAGITKLDGSEFTADDMHKFSWKVSKVHQNMHGIYNKEDMSMIQSIAIGRLGFMFRKFMPPAWHRRFDPENFDFDLDEVDKGYYRSFGSFLTNLYSDLKQGQINILTNWKKLTPKDKANVKRSLTEIGSFLAVAAAFMLLSGAWKGDDDWWKSFVLYQIRRQQTELGVMTPLVITQFQEGFTILKSPAAAVNYSEHLVNILRVWDIWQPKLQSGTYEGWNRYARDLVRPLPYHNAIRRAINPKEPLKFLENN